MWVLRVWVAALVVVWSPLDVQAQNVGDQFQVPVSDRFTEGEIGASGEFRRIYAFLWDVIEVDGRIAVCGVGYFREPRARTVVSQIMGNATITLNEEVIHTGIRFFNRAMTNRRLTTTPANCVVTAAEIPRGRTDIFLNIGGGTIRN